MSKDLITRTATELYKEKHMLPENGIGIENLLFSTDNSDPSASFRLDRLISSPHGLTYRSSSNQSVIRRFKAGTTELVEVPRASEKTPIDEELRDAVAAGSDATEAQMTQMIKNVENIIEDHAEGHAMTKAKQALDTVRTGVFNAKGVKGADLGLDFDHERSASGDLTYDFTAGGATMNEALLELSDAMDSEGVPPNNRYAIMGSDWRSQFGSDSGIIEIMKANNSNQILEQQMFNQKFGNVNGLNVIAHYRPVGATSPLWILSYEPGVPYIAYDGATAAPFVPATSLIGGCLDDKTYNVKRGVDAFNDMGKVDRVVGDLVIDSYSDNDPITTFVRSTTRHIYVYGNIDHTFESVGTFS